MMYIGYKVLYNLYIGYVCMYDVCVGTVLKWRKFAFELGHGNGGNRK